MEHAGDALILGLSGDWKLGSPLPSSAQIEKELEAAQHSTGRIGFDTGQLRGWDSALLTFLVDVRGIGLRKHIGIDKAGLPQGVQRLLGLASAVPEKKGARREQTREPFLERVGDKALTGGHSLLEAVGFIGEIAASLGRMLTGRARFRASDLWVFLQESGSQALPIVSLISLLVGLILAFVGSIQLSLFGAQIYVADPDNYMDSLITIGGGRNLATGATMTKDDVLKANPDVIIVPLTDWTQATYDSLKNGREPWMQWLKAVKEGRVYAVDYDAVGWPGPRMSEGAMLIAKVLHREMFA